MNKVFTSLLVLIALSINIVSAQSLTELQNKIKKDAELLTYDTTRLVTNNALNNFYARKAAYYLSGSSDLSMFGNYFFLNTAENRMALGHNFLWRNKNEKKSSYNRIRNILSISIKADIKNGFSSIYSSEELTDNIGVGLKYTLLGNGSIKFDNTIQTTGFISILRDKEKHKAQMNERIKIYTADLLYSIEADSIKFFNSLKFIEDDVLKQELTEKFYKKMEKQYSNEFDKKLSQELDNEKYYSYSFFHWATIEAYVPFTSVSYNISPSSDFLLDNITEQKFRLFEAFISYTQLWQSKPLGNLFINLQGKAYLNNSIKTDDMQKIGLTEYQNFGGSDTLILKKLGEKEAYIGDFRSFWTPSISAKVVYFFPEYSNAILKNTLSKIGLSANIEKMMGDYNPLNLQFGMPIHFKGKNEKNPVNFELQCKIDDINNDIVPDKGWKEKLIIGISVGIPFGGLTN